MNIKPIQCSKKKQNCFSVLDPDTESTNDWKVVSNNHYPKNNNQKNNNQKNNNQKNNNQYKYVPKTLPCPSRAANALSEARLSSQEDSSSSAEEVLLLPAPLRTIKDSDKTKCFDQIDDKMALFEKKKSTIMEILAKGFSEEEYQEALQFVCIKNGIYSEKDFEDWYIMYEAQCLTYDRILMSHGIKPCMSDTLSEPIIVNKPVTISVPEVEFVDPPLPYTFALLCEWQNPDTQKWESETVAIMRTIMDFWNIINSLEGNPSDPNNKFCLPLTGKGEIADKYFQCLISQSNKQNSDDGINISGPQQEKVRKIISQYNALFPIWSFVRVNDSTNNNSTIDVPFIRVGGRSVNDININLKDTRANQSMGIYVMTKDFTCGYICNMVLSFIGGCLPDDIMSIVFNKTIAVNGATYFRGYRLRILVNTSETKTIIRCRDYIETDFIQEYPGYSKCLVRRPSIAK